MKRLYIIYMLVLICGGKVLSQDISNIRLSGEFQNKPLKEILLEIEEQHPVTFFFKEEWLSGICTNNKTGPEVVASGPGVFSGWSGKLLNCSWSDAFHVSCV